MESPYFEYESDDYNDRPLLQRPKQSTHAPQVVGNYDSESGIADVDSTNVEEILEDGSGVVLELQVEHGTIRTD